MSAKQARCETCAHWLKMRPGPHPDGMCLNPPEMGTNRDQCCPSWIPNDTSSVNAPSDPAQPHPISGAEGVP